MLLFINPRIRKNLIMLAFLSKLARYFEIPRYQLFTMSVILGSAANPYDELTGEKTAGWRWFVLSTVQQIQIWQSKRFCTNKTESSAINGIMIVTLRYILRRFCLSVFSKFLLEYQLLNGYEGHAFHQKARWRVSSWFSSSITLLINFWNGLHYLSCSISAQAPETWLRLMSSI